MLSLKQNLGTAERIGSGLVATLLSAGAVYLWVRAITGHCAIYERFELASAGGVLPKKRPDLVKRFANDTQDVVELGSDLSFPASDPPAH